MKELLSPAGNMECLKAAVNNGADAIYLGGKTFGARAYAGNFSNEELKEETSGRVNYKVQRYKGLGEMNANQLWETTMDPNERKLIKVNITDAALAEKRVSVLMGDAVEPRKNWIEENVIFSLEDDYKIA